VPQGADEGRFGPIRPFLRGSHHAFNAVGELTNIHGMDIRKIDLNLLRLFDAVYRLGNVSRAAEALNLSQPAASQGLTRLRRGLRDALFVRAPGGVRPTPRGRRLALGIQSAIAAIEGALNEIEQFEPAQSGVAYRFSLTDIGESHMLPRVMAALRREAPGIRLESLPLPHAEIRDALDSGVIDFAMGFLPSVQGTQRVELMHDRYVLLLRAEHPLLERRVRGAAAVADLARLEYIGVRSHPETLHILHELGLSGQVRLTASQLLAAPPVVQATDLAVLMPRTIARRIAETEGQVIVEPSLPHNHITVSLHWSKRFEADPAHVWMRQLLMRLFRSRKSAG
jgi:DNA-binding transcriptional LysR family regulator